MTFYKLLNHFNEIYLKKSLDFFSKHFIPTISIFKQVKQTSKVIPNYKKNYRIKFENRKKLTFFNKAVNLDSRRIPRKVLNLIRPELKGRHIINAVIGSRFASEFSLKAIDSFLWIIYYLNSRRIESLDTNTVFNAIKVSAVYPAFSHIFIQGSGLVVKHWPTDYLTFTRVYQIWLLLISKIIIIEVYFVA